VEVEEEEGEACSGSREEDAVEKEEDNGE